MIHKLGKKKYRLVSHTGKNLGEASSLEAIKKREQQVEYFKHQEHARKKAMSK